MTARSTSDLAPWTAIDESAPYLEGSHHVCDGDRAMQWAIAAARSVGVTRVSDLTDLHPMRIPVTQALRPGTAGEVRTMGKGATRDGAVTGALMEAVERACAEVEPGDPRLRPASSTTERVPLDMLHVSANPRPYDDSLPWVEAQVIGGGTKAVPLELLTLSWQVPIPAWAGRFRATSNGLAAGFTRTSAMLQGLCEVIERDAVAMWDLSSSENQAATMITPSSVRDPQARSLMAAMAKSGLWIGLWNITSPIGIPAIHAGTLAKDPASLHEGEVPAAGLGCHPDPVIALRRALSEAAQSRISALHGMDASNPAEYLAAGELRAGALEQIAKKPTFDFSAIEDHSSESAAEDLAWVVDAVEQSIGSQVLTVDLTHDHLPPVVKMIVPGTETSLRLPGWTPGPRARQLLGEVANDDVDSENDTDEPVFRGPAERPRQLVLAPVGTRHTLPVVFVHADRLTQVERFAGQCEIRPAARPGDLVDAVEAGARSILVIDIDATTQPRLSTEEGMHVLRAGVPLVGGCGLGSYLANDLRSWGAVAVGEIAATADQQAVVNENDLNRLPDSCDRPTVLLALDHIRASGAQSACSPEVLDAMRQTVDALSWRHRTAERIDRALRTVADDAAAQEFADAIVSARAALFDAEVSPAIAAAIEAAEHPIDRAAMPAPPPTTLWDSALRWIAPDKP